MRVTGHGLSSLTFKFLIFIFFFFRLGNCSWYHSFPKTTYFFLPLLAILLVTNLVTPHYLSTSFHFMFWLLSKVLSQNVQFFFPRDFNFTLLGNYIWLLNFLVNPSRTAIDQYCHNRYTVIQLEMHALHDTVKEQGRTRSVASVTNVLRMLHCSRRWQFQKACWRN